MKATLSPGIRETQRVLNTALANNNLFSSATQIKEAEQSKLFFDLVKLWLKLLIMY